MTLFEGNKRRGNLPSLINGREFFTILRRITLLQAQSKEIASRMQQFIASLALRLQLTKARNDESNVNGAHCAVYK
jgi:hypothetical protein